jgi:ubiquinone/menaquinone biosynthesis C-methylase UbiE
MKVNLRQLRPLRRRYSGVLWQHPLVARALPVSDAIDKLLRSRNGLRDLPPYSVRVRSASMVGELGGQRWIANGQRLKAFLVEHAGLKAGDRVLEVGCGAGRQALALSDYLESGGYVGFDVDEASVRACQEVPALDRFTFFVADVENEVYRPGGSIRGSEYRFPLEDGDFDVVFLASVFTHMLEADCANYAREIMRVLKPGGVAAISTYLKTPFAEGQPHRFAHRAGVAYLEYPDVPTKLVSYEAEAFERWFAGDVRQLFGSWRGDGREQIGEWQDWVIVRVGTD